MKIQAATIRCEKCKHDFQSELLVDVEVSLFTKALKSIKCPKCGKGLKSLSLVKTEEVLEVRNV